MISIDELLKGMTVVEIENAITSKFWRIVEGTAKERLETVRTLLEVGNVSYKDGKDVATRPASFEELKEFQGQCKELRWILMLPAIWKEQKIQEAILDKEQKEANDE